MCTACISFHVSILQGQRTDSQTYVRMKKLAAEKAGFNFLLKEVNAEVTQDQLLDIVQELNRSPEVCMCINALCGHSCD